MGYNDNNLESMDLCDDISLDGGNTYNCMSIDNVFDDLKRPICLNGDFPNIYDEDEEDEDDDDVLGIRNSVVDIDARVMHLVYLVNTHFDMVYDEVEKLFKNKKGYNEKLEYYTDTRNRLVKEIYRVSRKCDFDICESLALAKLNVILLDINSDVLKLKQEIFGGVDIALQASMRTVDELVVGK